MTACFAFRRDFLRAGLQRLTLINYRHLPDLADTDCLFACRYETEKRHGAGKGNWGAEGDDIAE